MSKQIAKKAAAATVAIIMAFNSVAVVLAADNTDDLSSHKLTERYSLYKTEIVKEEKVPYYAVYLQNSSKSGYRDAKANVSVDLAAGVTDSGETIKLTDGSFFWKDESIKSTDWKFDILESGYYNVEFMYTSAEGSTDSPRRKLEIDGKMPFSELNNVVFDRLWCDDGEPTVNAKGNQIRPAQKQIFRNRTILLEDALGRYNAPLKIYLEKGTHTLNLEAIQESVILRSIRFTAPESIKPYAEVTSEYQKSGYKNASGEIKIDAEKPAEKSSVSIRLETSADPLADPSAINNIVFNAIGGTNWSEGNKYITWSFDVSENGLYQLNLRALQKYNDGLSSYRQIKIDDKVPFAEFLCYEFRQKSWSTLTMSDENNNPYLLYLEAGKHTITMTVKTSPYLSILLELETTLDMLSKLIQEVIMITGIKPDINFDYRLDRQIPDLIERMQKISDSLDIQIQFLTNMAEAKTSTANGLETIKYRIDKMIRNPFIIPKLLEYMIADQTTLSSWISGFNNLALMIDYISFASPDKKQKSPQANFFQYAYYSAVQFLNSFTHDYATVSRNSGDIGKEKTQKTLDVWISRGKEWAQTLDQLIEQEFVKKKNINVNLNMLPAGQLGVSGVVLLALASGTAPDIVIGTDSVTPAEYGMRGAVLDLTQFGDYQEVSERFLKGALIPYQFKGAVYGLPETMDFTVMYYREDIMNSLGLKLPNTWEELYSTVLPELKRNGMDFWYEGSLYTFLFQNGGKLYSEDGKASVLNSPQALTAFKTFTELYTIYQVPVLASFYNRFRAGQMPLGISSFTTYLQLVAAAPEIEGKWKVSLIPGTRKEDGAVDRSTMLTLTSSMIFKNTALPKESWEFLKWYHSKDTQVKYANDLIAYIGSSAKWFSANVEAFDSLSWDTNLKNIVKEQRKWLQGIPNVTGGYITARHIENARVRTVVQGMNPRESIERAADDITRELITKNKEFDLRAKIEAEKK